MTPTTYGRDFAYCLKSHGGVRGFNASLWRFLLRCTLFCHSVATFLTSVSSYEGGCGFEAKVKLERSIASKRHIKKGEIIKKEDLHMLSPGDGFKWNQLNEVVGKTAREDIPVNEIIYFKYIQ